MRTAVITDKDNLEGVIPELFSEGEYLIIYDDEVGEGEIIKTFKRSEATEDGDMFFAKKIVESDCEVVICGQIEEGPFVIIADQGQVTRYNGSGKKAGDAIKMMENYELEFITDFIGGMGCHTPIESEKELEGSGR